MRRNSEYILVFACGAVIYGLIEVVFRGFTHWTMSLTGGLIFFLLYIINEKFGNSLSLLTRCVIGSALITAVEFVVGCIVNLWLAMDVWDYSNMPYNLLGQICLPFSALWLLLALPANLLCTFIRKMLKRQGARESANQLDEI